VDSPTTQRRAEHERQEHPHHHPRRSDRDPFGPLLRREPLTRELRDRVEDEWLRNGDDELPREGPAEVVAEEPQQSAKGGQQCAGCEPAVQRAVQHPTGGDREHDIEQRKDLRQPADRALGHPVMVGRAGRDRRVRQPQQLRRSGDEGEGTDHDPAVATGLLVGSGEVTHQRFSALATSLPIHLRAPRRKVIAP